MREDLFEEGWGEEHFLPQIFLPVQRIEMREVERWEEGIEARNMCSGT